MVPKLPDTEVATLPLALPTVPAATPVTARPAPVSLVSTLPVGVVPEVPLAVPPASTAVAVSVVAVAVATNVSPLIVQLRVPVSVLRLVWAAEYRYGLLRQGDIVLNRLSTPAIQDSVVVGGADGG